MKFVYSFEDGNKDMKSLLGGKGANLAEMSNIGLSVPSGFTITTEACLRYLEVDKLEDNVVGEIENHLAQLERKTGKLFGDRDNPLLVSVRSGAAISMPGMMDTILNLGISEENIFNFSSDKRFALDSYRRLLQMFSNVVLSLDISEFEEVLDYYKNKEGVHDDSKLSVSALESIVSEYKLIISKGYPDFDYEPKTMLYLAIEAVFKSWNNNRAKVYRREMGIPDSLGTAVNIQSMVFGNFNERSATGVAFTRNPSSGERKLFGEYLINAQGEDVVAGIRTPKGIGEMKDDFPNSYETLVKTASLLENHYKEMQDIEFTIENDSFFILQTRTGKRTAKAKIQILTDMVEEELIDKKEAIKRIEPEDINSLLHPVFNAEDLSKATELARGLPASPGCVSGKIYFNKEEILEAKARGEKTILVRKETSPEDIEGMISAGGIITSRGGMTSHAAVVARGMGKPCVVGCKDMMVDERGKKLTVYDIELSEGDVLSFDGEKGIVYLGSIGYDLQISTGGIDKVIGYSKDIKKLGVMTNADTPRDAKRAIEFGAEGIGLCRTEHMFFEKERILHFREMILSRNEDERSVALEKLFEVQKEDFRQLFSVLRNKPVTIRLLDPPLHEFLPKEDDEIGILADELGRDKEELKEFIDSLIEINPMLGHRGVRLGVTFEAIYMMQAKAIFEGARLSLLEDGVIPKVEIMIPLVGFLREFTYMKDLIKEFGDKYLAENGLDNMPYKIGTMIEVPRATLIADDIAREADFFSFGTNDLTQMTLGFSRDDIGKFLDKYLEKGMFEYDPFESLDIEGVGKLIDRTVGLARSVKPDFKIGVCGEQGGEPRSIEFFRKAGLSYVSCSPFRVPVAIVTLAKLELENPQ